MREIVVDPADLVWMADQQWREDEQEMVVQPDSRIVVFYHRGRICAASSIPKFQQSK